MSVLRGIRDASAGRDHNTSDSTLLCCLFFWRCWVRHVYENHSALLYDVTIHSYLPLPLHFAPNDILHAAG
jgi:hypothetical protein